MNFRFIIGFFGLFCALQLPAEANFCSTHTERQFLNLEGPNARFITTRDDLNEAGEIMARAFFEDGQMDYVFPDRPLQLERLQWLMPRILRQGAFRGKILTNKDGPIHGAAIWYRSEDLPGKFMDLVEQIRVGLLLAPFKISMGAITKLERLKKFLDAVKRQHCPKPKGCYYLYFLATDPQFQRKGIARALIEPAIQASNRDGVPLYLETQKEANVAIYQRFGFKVVFSGKEAPDAPVSFVMMRDPILEERQ